MDAQLRLGASFKFAKICRVLQVHNIMNYNIPRNKKVGPMPDVHIPDEGRQWCNIFTLLYNGLWDLILIILSLGKQS